MQLNYNWMLSQNCQSKLNHEDSLETFLKNYIIMSIKAKTVFQLIPVGPFKEKSKFTEKK